MIDAGYYLAHLGLGQLKMVGQNYNFRCPFCPSDKRGNKAYILGANTEKPYFYCHRCQKVFEHGNHLSNFIKDINYPLWQEYISEQRKNNVNDIFNTSNRSIVVKKTEYIETEMREFHKWLRPLSALPNEIDVKQYISNRSISENHQKSIFYFIGNPYSLFYKLFPNCENEQYREKSKRKICHKGALVPFINAKGKGIGFGIRLLKPIGDLRFINLFANVDNSSFLLGENKVNFNKPFYVLEGLIDKITLAEDKQILAMLSINQKLQYVKSIAKATPIYVFDNEYLNSSVVKNIRKVIKFGFDVFIWPDRMLDVKDVNDLKVIRNWKDQKIFDLFKKNTYTSFEAELVLEERISQAIESLIYRRK